MREFFFFFFEKSNDSNLGCDETFDSFIDTLDNMDCMLQPLRKRYRKSCNR
jgi:hypothetical protein